MYKPLAIVVFVSALLCVDTLEAKGSSHGGGHSRASSGGSRHSSHSSVRSPSKASKSHAAKSSVPKSTAPKIGGTTSSKVENVKSYNKKDGTHVDAHKRTSPNATKRDNFSAKGNINPYTGKSGTKDLGKK